MTKYLVTGASGQLGQLVVDHLETLVEKSDIIALVRSDEAAEAYAAKGIATRRGDYTDAASLEAAFDGVDRVLLISSSEIGQRAVQHGNVIDAAKAAGVGFVAYTSILGAQENPMQLAGEHKITEDKLAESGLSHSILRNGWYTENFLMSVPTALEMGQFFTAAGEGQFSTASRQDYAEAAARVLAGGHDGEVLELAGDTGYPMAAFVDEVSKVSGKPIALVNLPEAALKDGLVQAGLPEPFAAILADSDARASEGYLFNDSKTLSGLIGRPTSAYADTVKAALA